MIIINYDSDANKFSNRKCLSLDLNAPLGTVVFRLVLRLFQGLGKLIKGWSAR